VYEACTVLQEKSCLKSKEASSVFQSFFLPAKFSHTIPFCSPQASADLGLAQWHVIAGFPKPMLGKRMAESWWQTLLPFLDEIEIGSRTGRERGSIRASSAGRAHSGIEAVAEGPVVYASLRCRV
jgi:hypothetical protein